MAGDGVQHNGGHIKPLGKISPQLGVGSLLVVVHRLAQIVEQATHLRHFDIGPNFGRQDGRNFRGFYGMVELVLAIGGAVAQTAEHLHNLGV